MIKGVAIVFITLFVALAACGPEEQRVIVNDHTITIEKRSFSIACDIDKQLGIAYFEAGVGDAARGYGGILTKEDYNTFCGDVK